MQKHQVNNFQEYWQLYDGLVHILDKEGKTEIASGLKDAKSYVFGHSDTWYQFKKRFTETVASNRIQFTGEQFELAEFLLTWLSKYFP